MKNKYIIGIDEVGRGPIAGPVTVCAFSVSKKLPAIFCSKIKDSKKLTPLFREQIVKEIKELKKKGKVNFAISSVSAKVIDSIGITKSVKRAIRVSLKKLNLDPRQCRILLDGLLEAPSEYRDQKTIIKGDEKEMVIGCASILAKVHRDRYMTRNKSKLADYGFEKHKGYGTKSHYLAIKRFGLSNLHRRSFLKNLNLKIR